jgi:hypothetical protein
MREREDYLTAPRRRIRDPVSRIRDSPMGYVFSAMTFYNLGFVTYTGAVAALIKAVEDDALHNLDDQRSQHMSPCTRWRKIRFMDSR